MGTRGEKGKALPVSVGYKVLYVETDRVTTTHIGMVVKNILQKYIEPQSDIIVHVFKLIVEF